MCKKISLKRDKLFLLSILAALALYVSGSVTYFTAAAGSVREDVVRLHVIANSDSAFDQQVKLKVRDALLNQNNQILSERVTPEDAVEHFRNSEEELLKTVNTTLKENDCDYSGTITVGPEYYSTREYGDLIFPAGEYMSLRVVLGDGEGQNWWCVMFPPLCIPVAGDVETDKNKTADILTESGEDIISSNGKYIIKFKLLELYEELKHKL